MTIPFGGMRVDADLAHRMTAANSGSFIKSQYLVKYVTHRKPDPNVMGDRYKRRAIKDLLEQYRANQGNNVVASSSAMGAPSNSHVGDGFFVALVKVLQEEFGESPPATRAWPTPHPVAGRSRSTPRLRGITIIIMQSVLRGNSSRTWAIIFTLMRIDRLPIRRFPFSPAGFPSVSHGDTRGGSNHKDTDVDI
jgi:hypothetical protein